MRLSPICRRYATNLICLGLILSTASAGRSQTPFAAVTSPKLFFGFDIGQDYCLANYKQLCGYWAKLEKESDRIRVVNIGTTEEGRPQVMAIVTSPANHQRLARLQEISRRLGKVETMADAEARQLAAEGKAVVWIDAGLHANESLCAQMLIETVYQFVSKNDPETQRILDDVVILFVHANPDGHDLVADWYMRESDPKKRSLSGLPRLYQKYIGHDNNRDFFAITQAETKNLSRVMYFDWLPQIVYNHHQAGPPGTVLFVPPFRDPFNYNVDPLVISGIDAVGAAMMQRFLVENKPGATVRSGTRYSTWWNGGLRTTCYFHNMIGLLSETIGNPTPMQIPFRVQLQLPRGDYLAPIAPQTWHLRQSVDYSVTANRAVLDYASRHREQLLYNIWLMGKNAVDRGNRDNWTVTPKVVDAARNNRPGRGAGEFQRLFRDPTKRDPRGYIIPADQPDFLTAVKFVNTLMLAGIKVDRAKTSFSVAGTNYPAGSYVIRCAQPFRAHVLDMFEPQDHPNDFAYPDGPPTPPYDIAGWTLAFQMGVKFDRILDGFDGPFEEVRGPQSPPRGRVTHVKDESGFWLDCRTNDSFRAVNRLLSNHIEVRRLRAPFLVDQATQSPGTFFVKATPESITLMEKLADELGTIFTGSAASPGSEANEIKPVRIGLWDRYGGSMPSGWTRWILERFEFPFQVVYVPELNRGNLKDKFDVLILVDGALPGRNLAAIRSGEAGGDQPPADPDGSGGAERNIPEEYRGRRGGITAKATIPQFRAFLEAGGTILTIGGSTALAQQLGVPVANHLVTRDKDGKEVSLPRDKFYVPGSLLRARIDPKQPLTWGLPEYVDVMFSASPTFRAPANGSELHRVAWFDNKAPLRSGWAWGQEHLENGVAIMETKVGKGRLVLFGPQVLFRGQPQGTFKLVFNGILGASSLE